MPYHGISYRDGPTTGIGAYSGKWTMYRGNHRSENWYSVAYWYQKGAHTKRATLPAVADRVPRLVNTDGPTVGKP